jgi:hydroxymethylbilane synthase
VTSYFAIEDMVPAAGQGIVALETLAASAFACEVARAINDPASELAARCERGVLQKFGQRLDCYSCVAVHATPADGEVTIRAFLSDYEAITPLHVTHKGPDAGEVVSAVAAELMASGAVELLGARA